MIMTIRVTKALVTVNYNRRALDGRRHTALGSRVNSILGRRIVNRRLVTGLVWLIAALCGACDVINSNEGDGSVGGDGGGDSGPSGSSIVTFDRAGGSVELEADDGDEFLVIPYSVST